MEPKVLGQVWRRLSRTWRMVVSLWARVVRRAAFDLRVDGLIWSVAFYFLRMWMVVVRAAIFVAVVIIVKTVDWKVGRFRFLFVTF